MLGNVLLGIEMAGSIGLSISSFIVGDQNYRHLTTLINQDLASLGNSVSKLKDSLSSLAEMVLQNCRGLDLLFLKEGGLCLALGETCCLYTNHSGVIRQNMAALKKCLQEREQAQLAEQNWFERWFSFSPWLSTLISAAIGPLIVLLVGVTIGPCIINKLVSYVKGRIQAVKLMILATQGYELVPVDSTMSQ